MKPLFAGLVLAVVGTYPGLAAPASFADGEMRYACGEDCPETQLICVRDAQPAPPAITLEDMADEAKVPWGQIDFWLGTGVVADRSSLEPVIDGKRSEGPGVVSFGGLDWVRADYDVQTATGSGLSASLLMWPGNDGMALLRCSFKPHPTAEAMIEELAQGLRQ